MDAEFHHPGNPPSKALGFGWQSPRLGKALLLEQGCEGLCTLCKEVFLFQNKEVFSLWENDLLTPDER